MYRDCCRAIEDSFTTCIEIVVGQYKPVYNMYRDCCRAIVGSFTTCIEIFVGQ